MRYRDLREVPRPLPKAGVLALDFCALFAERRPLSITATITQHITGAAGGVEFLA